MPELPEVETTASGIRPHLLHQQIADVAVRQKKLRQPVTRNLGVRLRNQTIRAVKRRAKYLLIYLTRGCVIIHLGMSGRLRVLRQHCTAEKHDHVDVTLADGQVLRFTDPRRFGCVLYTAGDPLHHKLLKHLGPEPFDDAFNADYLYALSRRRSVAVKNFIMNGHIVVGVGNIYASEALHRAGILPHRQAGRISRKRYATLVQHVCDVLREAIRQGGTTLRDFTNSDGFPGYFKQELDVYDRQDLPCNTCGDNIRMKVIGQRSSYYCLTCQA
ncbi:MAG: bifunctional DNA-formamidopyrimidine glycosylase/DNA-(apurinic or apyrimidinic site) lyase [Gammaproteobacteria bacterium]|nr:bifunctional DNA-formamidopyrimidine glycosylase/DNA-(apurinic or apyrimidinic site) lyase [Gammaproteobacteria bacterium]